MAASAQILGSYSSALAFTAMVWMSSAPSKLVLKKYSHYKTIKRWSLWGQDGSMEICLNPFLFQDLAFIMNVCVDVYRRAWVCVGVPGCVQGFLGVCRAAWVCAGVPGCVQGCLGVCRRAWVCVGVPAEFRRVLFPLKSELEAFASAQHGLCSLKEQHALLTMEPSLGPSRPFSISSLPGALHRALHQCLSLSQWSVSVQTQSQLENSLYLIYFVSTRSETSHSYSPFHFFFQADLDYSLGCPPTHYILASSFHALGS